MIDAIFTDGTLITLISLGAITLFVIGIPILLVIGLWVVAASMVIDFTLANIGVTLFEGLNFYGLLALPLFILTGDLINASGIARRLTDFSFSVLGWMRGGMAMSSLGASGMFAAISGSNSATTATIGSIMHPKMVEGNYDKHFSAATIAAGGTVGIIIPPSLVFIIYGFLLNLSITDLFIAGIIPGLMMIGAMQLVCVFISYKNGWGNLIKFEIRRVVRTGIQAYLGFVAIFIIIYGIYSGKFSPTEAAGVTAAFCLLAGLFVTRELKLKDLPGVVMRSARITGVLAPLVAISIVMQQVLSLLGAADAVGEFISSLGGYYAVLFACMGMVLLAGTVLESVPNTIMLAPILAPVAYATGIDPIHFAVVFLIGDAIGFITPPYGLNLYVASSITGIPYFRILHYTWPYLGALLLVWVSVALIPELTSLLSTQQGAGTSYWSNG